MEEEEEGGFLDGGVAQTDIVGKEDSLPRKEDGKGGWMRAIRAMVRPPDAEARRTAPVRSWARWGGRRAQFASLVGYTFMAFFQPAAGFAIDYWVRVKQYSNDGVATRILPAWTYAYATSSVVLAVLAETPIRHRPLIVVGVSSLTASWVLAYLASSQLMLVASEVLSSLFYASDAVASAFLYLIVEKPYWQVIASAVRAVKLFSLMASALLGQILADANPSDQWLMLLTVALVAVGIAFSLFLPAPLPPKKTRTPAGVDPASSSPLLLAAGHIQEAAASPLDKEDEPTQPPSALGASVSEAALRAARFLRRLLQPPVLRWIFWCAVCYGMHMQTMVYWQSLFEALDSSRPYFGLIVVAFFGVAFISTSMPSYVEPIVKHFLGTLSWVSPLVLGVLLYLMTITSFYPSLLIFILYGAVLEFHFPLALTCIARGMGESSVPLAYSVYIVLMLSVQTAVQLVIESLGLNPFQAFALFGAVDASVGVLLFFLWALDRVIAMARLWRKK